MERLDIELVKRGIYKTRSRANLEIKAGKVACDGKIVSKSGFMVDDRTNIEIIGEKLEFVSRAGLKLKKAVEYFDIMLDNKVLVDIGSSTGGFTDFAIRNSILKVYAIDVGKDQFDKELAKNPQIHLFEETDFRKIDIDLIKDTNIATIDVSFISSTKLISKLVELPNLKEIILLIKPQFEVGIEVASKYKGIIKNEEDRKKAIESVIKEFEKAGFISKGVIESPIQGGDGNIEYLAYFLNDRFANERKT